MKTPGVRVAPLITLDGPVDGKQEINQVFFEDVKVPKENLIGEENKGWTYAKCLLEFERSNPYSAGLARAGESAGIGGKTQLENGSLADDKVSSTS